MEITIGFVSEHEVYECLGLTKSARLRESRSLFEHELSLSMVEEIRLCINKDWVIGNENFKKQIEEMYRRMLTVGDGVVIEIRAL